MQCGLMLLLNKVICMQELDYMQQDIVATSTQALNDKASVDQELEHLSRCVLSFQQRIAQVIEFSSQFLLN